MFYLSNIDTVMMMTMTMTMKQSLTDIDAALDTFLVVVDSDNNNSSSSNNNNYSNILDEIVRNEKVLNYVRSVLQQMFAIYKAYYYYDDDDAAAADSPPNGPIVLDTLKPESSATYSGHVLDSRIEEVVARGNLREQMTMLLNFKMKPEAIVLWKLLLWMNTYLISRQT